MKDLLSLLLHPRVTLRRLDELERENRGFRVTTQVLCERVAQQETRFLRLADPTHIFRRPTAADIAASVADERVKGKA